jgi:activator of 2-hydroxyglutaryl-CoA dehydratase
MKKLYGLDAGSVSVKLALVDSDRNILETKYVRHKGNPLKVSCDILKQLPPDSALSVTGSAGKLIARAFGMEPVNEVVALSYSSRIIQPGNIILK